MSARACQRLWQVEAVRDGRLAGKELANALRHRAECADCSLEYRALSDLGRQIASVPARGLTALSARRARQRLLGAWNEQLLIEPQPRRRRQMAIALALAATLLAAAAAAAWLNPKRDPQPKPATHLGEHAGVPEPSVAAARLPEATPRASTPGGVVPEPALVASAARPAPAGSTKLKRDLAPRKPVAASADTEQDDAYLRIVGLLRSGQAPEAQLQARQYLRLYPNGFRSSGHR